METKVVTIGDRKFEIMNENRLSARIFEAIAARSSTITEALDRARLESFNRDESETVKPTYKHTMLLGKDDEGHNLRANISVFPNSVVVQTLREID